jgi:DNA invertase Pin-like site-specific DNA recombinase
MASKKAAKQAPESNVKRVALYLRVSNATENKASAKARSGRSTNSDHTSIDSQRDRGRAYVASQANWHIVAEYVDDGRSGKDLERPEMQRMLADIEAGKIDVVVTYKIDRLSRSLRDFVSLMERFAKAKASFACVTQNFKTDDPVGRLTLNILASFAEFERDMIIERTRDKIATTRAQGLWSGGRAPLGYKLDKGHLVIAEAVAPITRSIFDRYIETRSAGAVAQALNAEARAEQPDAEGKRPRAWTRDSILRVLTNPVYTGVIEHDGQTYQGKHEPIIDRATFDRVQAIIKANTVEGERKGRNARYLLQSIIRCACGYCMSPGTSGNAKGSFRYYRCVARDKQSNECNARPLPAEAIETFVTDRLHEIAASGTVAANLTAYARELVTTARPTIAARVATLQARIVDVADKSARASEAMINAPQATRAKLAAQADSVQSELADLESELARAEQRQAMIDTAEAEAKWIADQLATFAEAWPLMTPDLRGRVLRGLVRTVSVNEAGSTIAITFAPLDATRSALATDAQSTDADRFAITITGELYRVRGRAVSFDTEAPAAPRAPASEPAAVARMLALAHSIENAVSSGQCPDLATMAERLRMTRARVSQVVALTCLAPDIQETILSLRAVDGIEPIRERAVRPVAMPLSWERQRAAWSKVWASAQAEAERPRAAPRRTDKASKARKASAERSAL